MKIIVCVKSVLKEAPAGANVRTRLGGELNPYDRPALALAARLARESGGAVTALTMGAPESGGDALLEARALGADHAVLISHPALAGSDTLVTSTVLAAAITRLAPYDLILFGLRTADSDTGQVGPQTAELLGLPFVGRALSVLRSGPGPGLTIVAAADGYRQTYQMQLPGALTVRAGVADEYDTPLAGIQAAYDSGQYQTMSLPDLDLQPEKVGLPGSPTQVRSIRTARRDRKCEIITGAAEEKAAKLLEWMIKQGVLES